MLKKSLAAAVALLTLVMMLAGCASTPSPAATPTAAPGSTEPDATPAPTDSDEPAPAPAEGEQVLYLHLGSQPETIDPQMNTTVDGSVYVSHLFEGLYRYKADGTGTELGLASDVKKSEDEMVWTFTIREGAKWSDGQPITAQDFVFSWQRMVNPAVAAPYGYDMGQFIKNGGKLANGENDEADPTLVHMLDGEGNRTGESLKLEDLGVKAIDDTTLEVTLENPCAFFEEIMAFPVLYPTRQDIIEANGDKWTTDPATCIVNGPYKLDSWTPDSELVMVPNENYWDQDRVKNDKLVFKLSNDANALAGAIRNGEVYYTRTLPTEEKQALKDEGYYGYVTQQGTYYVCYNHQKEPLNNPLVRKALTLAIDANYISQTVLQNSYAPGGAMVNGAFADVEPGSSFAEVRGKTYWDLNDMENNIKMAQEALAEAGYPNGEGFPTLEYLLNADSPHKEIAEALQQMWKDALNITVNLQTVDWAVMTPTRRAGDFQIARNGWVADYDDPSSMLTLFTSDSGNNDGKYSNPEYDAKVAEAMSTADRAAHMKALHEAEDILMNDWAEAPILYYNDEFLQSPKLTGVTHNPRGNVFFYEAQYTAE